MYRMPSKQFTGGLPSQSQEDIEIRTRNEFQPQRGGTRRKMRKMRKMRKTMNLGMKRRRRSRRH